MTETRGISISTLTFAWAIILAAAFVFDRPVAVWVRDDVPIIKNDRHPLVFHVLQRKYRVDRAHLILETLKLPGWFPFTLGVATLLAIFHRRHLAAALPLALSGILVGFLYSVIKWIAGRHRPVKGVDPWGFHPFPHGISGIWREQALCFPSGHASLSFASATCLAMVLPRWRAVFFCIAFITCGERVLENAHYLSDVVAGAGMGALCGWWISRTIL